MRVELSICVSSFWNDYHGTLSVVLHGTNSPQSTPGCTKIDCSTCAENKGHNIMIITTCLKGSCSDSEVLVDLIKF